MNERWFTSVIDAEGESHAQTKESAEETKAVVTRPSTSVLGRVTNYFVVGTETVGTCRLCSIALCPQKRGKNTIKWTPNCLDNCPAHACVFVNMKMSQRESRLLFRSSLYDEELSADLSANEKGKIVEAEESQREIFHALMATKMASYYQTQMTSFQL